LCFGILSEEADIISERGRETDERNTENGKWRPEHGTRKKGKRGYENTIGKTSCNNPVSRRRKYAKGKSRGHRAWGRDVGEGERNTENGERKNTAAGRYPGGVKYL
jgi:hypothetical protein